jgi:CrcB protein
LDKFAMVFFGGGAGALARYILGTALTQRFGSAFPIGTFVINITGSFLIGLLMTIITERFQPDPRWRLILVVGFLGGYTTFSSFEYETYQSVRQGGHWMALLYVLSSVVVGYAAVLLGVALAARR